MKVVDSSGWLEFFADGTLALTAADLGLEHGLAMADSLIYATAVAAGAELVTSDADFASLPGVIYLPKPKPGPAAPG